MRSSILRTKNNRFYGRDKWAQKNVLFSYSNNNNIPNQRAIQERKYVNEIIL